MEVALSSSFSLILGPLLLVGAFFLGRWYERRYGKRPESVRTLVRAEQESRETQARHALALAQEAKKLALRPGNRADADRMLQNAQAFLRKLK